MAQQPRNRFIGPFSSVLEVTGWILRDPLRPSNWKISVLALGLMTTRYMQAFLMVILIYGFSDTSELPLHLKFGKLDLGTYLPHEFFRDVPLAFTATVFGIFVLQAVVAYKCRVGLVSLAMHYYKRNIDRAARYYGAGLIGQIEEDRLLLSKDMLVGFSLREARYLASAFLSFANSVAGLMIAAVGLTLIFILDWQLTLILLCAVVFLVVAQSVFVGQGLVFSQDVLAGSGEMTRDVRSHLLEAELHRVDAPELEQHLANLTRVVGSKRFLRGYESRIILSYRTTLSLQFGFAILLGVIVTVFLMRVEAGEATSAEVVRYCVLLLPLFAATNALVTAVVGVTTSHPYFENYMMVFGDRENLRMRKLLSPSRNAPAGETDSQPQVHAREPLSGWHQVLAPLDGLDWAVFQRLWKMLQVSGLAPQGTPDESAVLIPDGWPQQVPSLSRLYGIEERLNIPRVIERHSGLKPFLEDLIPVVDGLYERSDPIVSEDIPPRTRTLLGITAAVQSDRIAVMSAGSFAALPERERIGLCNATADLPFVVITPRVPAREVAPPLQTARVLALDGSSVELDPANVLNIPESAARLLRKQSLTFLADNSALNELD